MVADPNVPDLVASARRGMATLAIDPTMRHYSPETLALVYQRTVVNLAGAGDLERAAEKIAADPALAAIPIDVVEAIVAASVKHFARALPIGADGA